jgi:hypothetical protein
VHTHLFGVAFLHHLRRWVASPNSPDYVTIYCSEKFQALQPYAPLPGPPHDKSQSAQLRRVGNRLQSNLFYQVILDNYYFQKIDYYSKVMVLYQQQTFCDRYFNDLIINN